MRRAINEIGQAGSACETSGGSDLDAWLALLLLPSSWYAVLRTRYVQMSKAWRRMAASQPSMLPASFQSNTKMPLVLGPEAWPSCRNPVREGGGRTGSA